MARKSRRRVAADNGACGRGTDKKVWNVGAYIRLSAVDRKQKGDSIENQQAIIKAFIAEQTDMTLVDTYIDNGTSGMTLEREEFQRMLSDIESGKINCCISKDLSRLGRSAIDTGYYIEKFFPTKNIRYIAITDGYDSINPNSGGVAVSLKNMVNESYALEIGRKIHTTKQMNIKNGLFVGAIPPYGYVKSKEDKHKLVCNEYSAEVVRKIFEMVSNGDGVTTVLNWLNGDKILPPRRYLCSVGACSEKQQGKSEQWNKAVIYSILKNRVYVGDMVQGKGRTNQYNCERISQKDWIIIENTHEPIVSRVVFEEVQKKFSGNTHKSNSASENIFLRKIFCRHCGYAMGRHNDGNNHSFRCHTRQNKGKDYCKSVILREDKLKFCYRAYLR